jgi:hypothetical protein
MKQLKLFEPTSEKWASNDPKSLAFDNAILRWMMVNCKPLVATELD